MNNTTSAILAAFLAGVCWAIGSFAVKYVLRDVTMHPTLAFALRELVTFIGVWIIIWPVAREQLPALWASTQGRQAIWVVVIFTGVVSSLIGHILLYYGLGSQQVSLSTVMALAYTSPVWASLLSVAFGLETFSWMRLAGVLITILGMGIVVYAK